MKIGVLALQGAFVEHIAMLKKLKVAAVPVRLSRELEGLDGLIIPGGESTAISRLLNDYHLTDKIKDMISGGLPVFGTCAGMIILATETVEPTDNKVALLGALKMTVRRNAFGRQRESFETSLSMPVLGETPFPGVFIRAPRIEKSNSTVEILARLDDGTDVAARQDRVLACAFHPELTDDPRLHQYFLDMVAGDK